MEHLCVDPAKRGALNVVGLDLDDERIAFAKDFVPKKYPELTDKISFGPGIAHAAKTKRIPPVRTSPDAYDEDVPETFQGIAFVTG